MEKMVSMALLVAVTLTIGCSQAALSTVEDFLQPHMSQNRDLWTCDALDCAACIGATDRTYCSSSNQQGTCCTKTDGRAPCLPTFRNCSTDVGYNATNNFVFLVCGFNESFCGANPVPQDLSDPEADRRFGKNYLIAKSDPITI